MTTAPIIVPCSGAPTCRGVALTVRPLTHWANPADSFTDDDWYMRAQAHRAVRDGHLLCLRPTADRPTCVGLSPTQFAVSSLQDDFAARALVVDPYDAEGNDLREVVTLLRPVGIAPMGGKTKIADLLVADMSPGLTEQEASDVERRPCGITCGCEACVVYWRGVGPLDRSYGPGSEDMTSEEAHDVAVWEASEAT